MKEDDNYHYGTETPLERSLPYSIFIKLGGLSTRVCEYELGDLAIAGIHANASDHLTVEAEKETLAVLTIREFDQIGMARYSGYPLEPLPVGQVPAGPVGLIYTGDAEAMGKTVDSLLLQYQEPGEIQDFLKQSKEKLAGKSGEEFLFTELPNNKKTQEELTKIIRLFLKFPAGQIWP